MPIRFATLQDIPALVEGGRRMHAHTRFMPDWGISAIDYGNSRYEYASASPSNNLGYGSISTQSIDNAEVLFSNAQINAQSRSIASQGLQRSTVNAAKECCYACDSFMRLIDLGCSQKTYSRISTNQSEWSLTA